MDSNSAPSTSNDAQINSLKSEIDQTLKSSGLLSHDDKKEKNEDIKQMIGYYDGMTKNIEDRRIRIAELAWQNLAISVTAFGVIIALQIIAILKIPLLLILSSVLVISFIKIREYQIQSNFKYPFLKFPEYGNRWKWFYYGNRFISEINANPSTVTKSKSQDELLYLRGLNLYLNNYSTETIDQELQNNLIQLFLLQVHNYYKNRFYLRLLNYDLITPRIMLVLQVIYWIIALIILTINPVATNILLTHLF